MPPPDLHPTLSTPMSGLWHWSASAQAADRLDGLDDLCRSARRAGVDYVAFKSHDGANTRYLSDAQLGTAKAACERQGLRFVLWQYVYAQSPPGDEAESFAATIRRFDPAFAFVDVEKEYEEAAGPVDRLYAEAFRRVLPRFPAAICPFGRADLHPGIDYQAWRDHGFGVAPQAYECESRELTPEKCAKSFERFWPVKRQWTVLGLYRGALGTVDGARLAASIRGLPVVNVSGWWSGEASLDQMRALATHATGGPLQTRLPAVSTRTVQRQLAACGFAVEVTGRMNPQTRETLRYFQRGCAGTAGSSGPMAG